MRRAVVLAAVAAALAGCGGSSRRSPPPPAPHLPRTLAQSWSREANAIAAALAANDACTAEQRAGHLRTEVIAAINEGRVPRQFLEPLTSAVNSLPSRIRCTPTPKPEQHGHGHGHGKGDNQGDGGD